MTPQEIIEAARRGYNASSSDPFFSDAQMYEWVYQASMELAKEGFLIEKVFTTTTVAGTQGYAYPTNVFAIKRITYDGEPLRHLAQREDDLLTGGDQDITTQGTPEGFVDFNQTIDLRPYPDAAATLKIWGYAHPSGVPTATSSLDLPDEWHIHLTNFLLRDPAPCQPLRFGTWRLSRQSTLPDAYVAELELWMSMALLLMASSSEVTEPVIGLRGMGEPKHFPALSRRGRLRSHYLQTCHRRVLVIVSTCP